MACASKDVLNPNTATVEIGDGGEGGDGLTATERMILEILLKKRANAALMAAIDETQPTSSQTKMVGQSGAPNAKMSPSRDGTKQKTEDKKKTPPAKGMEKSDEMSDGPLEEEELEALMDEFGLGEADVTETEDESQPLVKSSSRGRGRARGGTKPNRGRGRGRGGGGGRRGRGGPPASMESESTLDEEDVDFGDDPVMLGTMAMEKMSDEQVVQFMEMYKKETNAECDPDKDYNAFMKWVSTKVQLVSNPQPITTAKKVTFGRSSNTKGTRGKTGSSGETNKKR